MWVSQEIIVFIALTSMSSAELDTLSPYTTHHGPLHRRLRDTQQCQHRRYGNTTYSLHKAHANQSDFNHIIDVHHKLVTVGEYYYNQRSITLRFQRVYNPERTLSVVEPGHAGTCEEGTGVRVTVQETARGRNCVAAANAGFFNTSTGQCLGNIVSDGRLVQDSGGIQNVHFGITKQGQLFTGYLSEIELVTLHFRQLVGGVIWLLRDGEVYVDQSRDIECPDAEETGTLDRFIGVVSARTAVGHDAEGRVLMVQVDGKTDQRGVDLHEFASVLKGLGFVNAVNMDGGGSATSILNGTLINYPSDSCPNSTWNCARQVSTVLCVHEVECSPHPHCSHHGQCVSGRCQCHLPWSGESCDSLICPGNCNGHGLCLEGGCLCEAGWEGDNCSIQCRQGSYGTNCSQVCQCLNNATCDSASGLCHCLPGFTGKHCQSVCGYGLYGAGCREQCSCPDQCFCHPVTGTCSNTSDNMDYLAAGQCLVSAHIRTDNLVPDQSRQLLMWKWLTLAAGLVALTSIGFNIVLTIILTTSHRQRPRYRPLGTSHRNSSPHSSLSDRDMTELLPLRGGEEESSLVDSSDEIDEETTLFQQRFPHPQVLASR